MESGCGRALGNETKHFIEKIKELVHNNCYTWQYPLKWEHCYSLPFFSVSKKVRK